MARRSVAPGRRRLHLRVEPVRERSERAEQQNRRPRDEAIEEGARAIHRGIGLQRAGASAGARARRVARVVVSLRGENDVGQLAHRAAAAVARRDVMRMRANRGRCVRHRHAEAACGQHGDVRQVVADVRALLGREPQIDAQPLPRRALVVRVLHEMRNAQLLRAMRHRGRAAPGDPRDDDAGVCQQMHRDAVERTERLELVAVVVDVDASVGQHAVDVARQQAHAARAGGQVSRHRRP